MPDLGRLALPGALGHALCRFLTYKGLTMIDLILPELIEQTRRQVFRPEYADKVTDEAVLGVILARHFKWDGRACFETLTHALSDSNFHTVNRALKETWETIERGNK